MNRTVKRHLMTLFTNSVQDITWMQIYGIYLEVTNVF